MYIKTVNDIESSPLAAGNGASMQMLISPEIAPHFAMRKFTIKTGGLCLIIQTPLNTSNMF